MLPDTSITNAMEFSDFRFRNLAKMSSPTVERMSLRNMLVASAARSAAILWRLQGDDCSMGHLHDSVQFYYYDHNAFRFSFHILIWKSQRSLDGKSSHLHKKGKPWRILVVVVKWHHRANGPLTVHFHDKKNAWEKKEIETACAQSLIKNKTQTAVINIVSFRILIHLTFPMLFNIHFENMVI